MNIYEKIKKMYYKVDILQFLKFSLVGVSNTILSLIVYYFLVFININYIIANFLGFIASVLNSYFLNSKYVFKKDKSINLTKSIIKVFLAYSITFLLNTGLLVIMIDYLTISKYIAPLINVVIITPINFFMNKYWVFK